MSEEHNEDYAANEDLEAMEEAPQETLEEEADDEELFEERGTPTEYESQLMDGAEQSSKEGTFFHNQGLDLIFKKSFLPPSKRADFIEAVNAQIDAHEAEGNYEIAENMRQNLSHFENVRQGLLRARKESRRLYKDAVEATQSNDGSSREKWNLTLQNMGVIPSDEQELQQERARVSKEKHIKKTLAECNESHNWNKLMRLLGD
jgi:hypothetical protein